MKLHRLGILLTFSLILLLAACSGGESETSENSTDSNKQTDANTSTENAKRGIIAPHPLGDATIDSIHFIVPNFNQVVQ